MVVSRLGIVRSLGSGVLGSAFHGFMTKDATPSAMTIETAGVIEPQVRPWVRVSWVGWVSGGDINRFRCGIG